MHRMVLLHTDDVDQDWLQALGRVGWEPRLCKHLECKSLYDGSQGNRFAGTFTKLQAFALIDFYKILLLDADLLVRCNVDHLFNRVCPAALRRHAGADTPDGQRMDGTSFFWPGSDRLRGGINAGVILLKPSLEVFHRMMEDLSAPQSWHHKSGMPEQDYLTLWFFDVWRSLHVAYNFQPHQVAFVARDRRLKDCTRVTTHYGGGVAIVHFSAVPKPRDKLLNDEYRSMDDRDFIHNVMVPAYLAPFGKERSEVAQGRPTPTAFLDMKELAEIAMKLHHDTMMSGLEWFARYAELRTVLQGWTARRFPFPSFECLVDKAVARCPHPGGALGTGASFAASWRVQGGQGERYAREVQDVCLWAAFWDRELAQQLGTMVCTPVSAAPRRQGRSHNSTGGSGQEGGEAPKDGRLRQALLRKLRKLKARLKRKMNPRLGAGRSGSASSSPKMAWYGWDGGRAIGAPL